MDENQNPKKTQVNLDFELTTVKGILMQQPKYDEMGQRIPLPENEQEMGRIYEIEPITVRHIVVDSLERVYEDEKKLSGRAKRRRDKLAEKIWNHSGKKMGLTVSQISIIAKLVNKSNYSTRVVSIVWEQIGYVTDDKDEDEDYE